MLLQRMRAEHGFEAEQVQSVDVHLNIGKAAYPSVMGRGPFAGRTGAVMSVPFRVTLALLHCIPQLAQVMALYGAGPMSQGVNVRPAEAISPMGSRLVIRLHSGQLLEAESNAAAELA